MVAHGVIGMGECRLRAKYLRIMQLVYFESVAGISDAKNIRPDCLITRRFQGFNTVEADGVNESLRGNFRPVSTS